MPHYRAWNLIGLLAFGCATQANPSSLPSVRLNYNEAVASSSNEQILLNLVRLRYLHAPVFFEVNSVSTQSRVRREGSVSVSGNVDDPDGFAPILTPQGSMGLSVEESPTVVYAPLQGKDFAERFVTPIRADIIMLLVQVGWRIDQIFSCCVQRVNQVRSPVISSIDESVGGHPFRQLAHLLYELQIHHALEVDFEPRSDRPPRVWLRLVAPDGDRRLQRYVSQVRTLLHLDPDKDHFEVVSTAYPAAPPAEKRGGLGRDPVGDPPALDAAPPSDSASDDEAPPPVVAADPSPPSHGRIVIRGRSLLSTMMYLSHGVAVPTVEGAARPLSWKQTAGTDERAVTVPNPIPKPVLRVRLHSDPPDDAYTRTFYRGHWYSIADWDHRAKQSFLLLTVLFSLLSTPGGGTPLFTIPIGS